MLLIVERAEAAMNDGDQAEIIMRTDFVSMSDIANTWRMYK